MSDSAATATASPDAASLALAPPRGRWRRAARALGALLIVAGVLALADAITTLLWQEPLSALYTTIEQEDLSGQLARIERAPPSPLELGTLASIPDERSRISYLAQTAERRARNGSPVGHIQIPRIGVTFVIVKGTSSGDLEKGPGIFAETGFPSFGHTTLIAGHRTTYLAPFRHIDELRPGDVILLRMPYAELTYSVTGHRVVAPSDVAAAVSWVGYARLVLSACTPVFSAAKRLLVSARLVRAVPRGPALDLPGEPRVRAIEPLVAQSSEPPLPAVFKPLDPGVLIPQS